MFDCSTTTYVWIDGQSCSMESRRVSLTSISLADARFTTRSANGCRISTWASWSTTWECPTSILNSWPTFPMAGRSARASCIATFCRWRAWPCSSSPRWWRNAKDSFSMFHPLQPSFQHRSSPCIPALRLSWKNSAAIWRWKRSISAWRSNASSPASWPPTWLGLNRAWRCPVLDSSSVAAWTLLALKSLHPATGFTKFKLDSTVFACFSLAHFSSV